MFELFLMLTAMFCAGAAALNFYAAFHAADPLVNLVGGSVMVACVAINLINLAGHRA